MIPPPGLASLQEHISRLGDAEFWRPYVSEILRRHGLTGAGREVVAGFNVTYPTFLYGDVVVKLFGCSRWWRQSHANERAALRLIAGDPLIVAPRLLAEGRLFDDDEAPWPYLITQRVPGVASWCAGLSAEEQRSLAKELGRQVRRMQALRPTGITTDADWPDLDLTAAAAHSSLPPHLVSQVRDYVARLAPFHRAFVHADLTANHVYVEGGRLTGIIDWGDAMLADRHYEIIQIYRDLFRCDRALLRVFLEASNWPAGEHFARQSLGLALYRQAVGLTQHHTMDVFQPIAARFPLHRIRSLDELADALYAV